MHGCQVSPKLMRAEILAVHGHSSFVLERLGKSRDEDAIRARYALGGLKFRSR
jgi:hypothetical protein